MCFAMLSVLDFCGLTALAIVVAAVYAARQAYVKVKSIAPEAATAMMPTVTRLAIRGLLLAVIGHGHRPRH